MIDEWESAERFHAFFNANIKVGRVTEAIGLAGAPAVCVFTSVDAPGTL